MSKIKIILGLITINLLFSTKALTENKIISISSILENPIDGEEVTLRGRIIDQEEGEKDYIFTDGKNKIVIELEENDFRYDPNENIEILGIVNLESEHFEQENDLTPENIEIDVNKLRVINNSR